MTEELTPQEQEIIDIIDDILGRLQEVQENLKRVFGTTDLSTIKVQAGKNPIEEAELQHIWKCIGIVPNYRQEPLPGTPVAFDPSAPPSPEVVQKYMPDEVRKPYRWE